MAVQPTLIEDVAIAGILSDSVFIGIGSQILVTTASQSGTSIVGTKGDFTSAMAGGVIEYANGVSAFITAFTDAFHLISTVTLTESLQSVRIAFNGTQGDRNGLFSITLQCINFSAVNIFCTNLTVFNDALIDHNLTVGNLTSLNILTTSGNATIGGTLTSIGLITGPNLVITNNITAGGTIQGQTLTALGNVNATNVIASNSVQAPTVNCTNLTATGTITGATITASGILSGQTINAGTGGITSAGNITVTNNASISAFDGTFSDAVISPLFTTPAASTFGFSTQNGSYSTVNGNFITTNGFIAATNGQVQTASLIVSGTSQLLGAIQIPLLTQVGSLLTVTATNYAQQLAPGSFYQPLLINPNTATHLQWGEILFANSGSATNWTGGSFSFVLRRIGTIVVALITWDGVTFTSNAPPFGSVSFLSNGIANTSDYAPVVGQEMIIFAQVSGAAEPFRFRVISNGGLLSFQGAPVAGGSDPSSSWAGNGVTLTFASSWCMTWVEH